MTEEDTVEDLMRAQLVLHRYAKLDDGGPQLYFQNWAACGMCRPLPRNHSFVGATVQHLRDFARHNPGQYMVCYDCANEDGVPWRR